MRFAGLRLVDFDGRRPDREQRGVRQVAGILSVLSAGLGLVWALVDEETHLARSHLQDLPHARFLRLSRFNPDLLQHFGLMFQLGFTRGKRSDAEDESQNVGVLLSVANAVPGTISGIGD